MKISTVVYVYVCAHCGRPFRIMSSSVLNPPPHKHRTENKCIRKKNEERHEENVNVVTIFIKITGICIQTTNLLVEFEIANCEF